eukprot:2539078-Amphidinium_carterae.1
MENESVGVLVERFAKLGCSLSAQELQQLKRIVEHGKVFLRSVASKQLDGSGSTGVLVQYSCDCTPLKLRKHYGVKSASFAGEGHGQSLEELFVQQIFLSFSGSSKNRPCIVLREPISLAHGK